MEILYNGLHLNDLSHLAPELTIVVSAIVLAIIDLLLRDKVSRVILGWLALVGIAVSAWFTLVQLGIGSNTQLRMSVLNGSYQIDAFADLLKLIFLLATGLIVLMSLGSIKKSEVLNVGELYYFLLPALLGAMMMASSTDLITLYVGLELLSVTTYILVGMRKMQLKSNEAAFKYIVQGGIASAMILYGMSFLYGISGTTHLPEIHAALIQQTGSFTALIYVAFFLLMAGLGFKIAAAPFHSWAPDVYQGAPTPITAFLAVISKGAALAMLFRMIYVIFQNVNGTPDAPILQDVLFSLSVLAAITMITGNILALRQKNVKRLLAFSGIANAGYLLVPLAVGFGGIHSSNFNEFIFYLLAYTLMNIGAFAILAMLEKDADSGQISAFAGLYYRAPWTAFAMVIMLLSLAGFPITGGFFGKLFIILGALETRNYWLPAIMITTSVISFYYYFGFIRQMFMRSDTGANEIHRSNSLLVVIWVCAVLTVLLGLFPQSAMNYIQSVFDVAKDLLMLA